MIWRIKINFTIAIIINCDSIEWQINEHLQSITITSIIVGRIIIILLIFNRQKVSESILVGYADEVGQLHQRRVGGTEVQREAVNDERRRSSLTQRPATSLRPVDAAMHSRQPRPITSIHFDSDEIQSTSPGNDDHGVTWGLNADRCTFETTFPMRDRRPASRVRLPSLPVVDDDDYADAEQDSHWRRSDDDVEEYSDKASSRSRQTLKRWTTLEDVYHTSMESVAHAEGDGRGDATYSHQMKRKPTRRMLPERDDTRAKNRPASLPSQSYFGFYLDSDGYSADDSIEEELEEEDEETFEETGEQRRRDNGDGDQQFTRAERLVPKAGSADWEQMQRDIHRCHSRAEHLFDRPSPTSTTTTPQHSFSTAQPRVHQRPSGGPVASNGLARRTVVAIRHDNSPQQQHHQTGASTSTTNNQSTAGDPKPNQLVPNSLDWLHKLLLASFAIILLGALTYKFFSPAAPPPKSNSTPSQEASLDSIDLIQSISAYIAIAFYA